MYEEMNKVPFALWDSETSPALLAQIFDRIAIPTFVIDSDHVILYWNSALEALSGLKREDMIGTRGQWKPFYNSPRPCLADLIVEGGLDSEVRRYYTDKYRPSSLIPHAYEAEDFFPECGENGEWLHFTAASLHNSAGECVGAIETLANISARKAYEAELIERERISRELSIIDALTGLNNSRHFHDKLAQTLEEARRYSHGFSLCIIDLDDFKRLNDNHGHMAGDSILEGLGRLVKDNLRLTDSAFRYGGEEFAVILPSTNYMGALDLANRLCEQLRAHSFETAYGERLCVTASIGVTEFKAGDDAKTIFNRADAAMYLAKANGKNCARSKL